jgi:hypothetical protein
MFFFNLSTSLDLVTPRSSLHLQSGQDVVKRTAATDVYAFALVAYAIYTGCVPFRGANEAQMM